MKPKPRRITRTLAELVPGAMGEALAAQGFAGTEIVQRWPEIAGPELARRSRPMKLSWPRQPRGAEAGAPRQPATLLVQVESAFALELQMQSAILLERINRYFGWRCVAAIRLHHGPVGERRPASRKPPVLSTETEKRLETNVGGIEDGRLAEALLRLGRAVATADNR